MNIFGAFYFGEYQPPLRQDFFGPPTGALAVEKIFMFASNEAIIEIPCSVDNGSADDDN